MIDEANARYEHYREMKMWVYEVLQGEQKKGMTEAPTASFEIGNKRSKRWTIPLSFVKDSLSGVISLGKERERRAKTTNAEIPLAAFVIARCIGARFCLRFAVPPCDPIRGMLRSHHARGTKRRSTLAWLRNPPQKTKHSLPMGYDVKLCFIQAQLLSH